MHAEAKPADVLNLMGVEGLELRHVKRKLAYVRWRLTSKQQQADQGMSSSPHSLSDYSLQVIPA